MHIIVIQKNLNLMDKLPWRDSGTGDNISSEATMFVWWILSDETKKQFYEYNVRIL